MTLHRKFPKLREVLQMRLGAFMISAIRWSCYYHGRNGIASKLSSLFLNFLFCMTLSSLCVCLNRSINL